MVYNIGIFCVLIFVLLSGCVKVSVKCDIDTIDGALEQCTENPTVTLEKDF